MTDATHTTDRGAPAPLLLRTRLLADGFTDKELRAAVRDHELVRLTRGVYSRPVQGAGTFSLTREQYQQRVLARAVKAPLCMVSHLSAAALHGLTLARASLDLVHLTVLGRSGGRHSDDVWHHTAQLADEDIVTLAAHGHVRVTSVSRTVVDIARTESLPDAVAIADDALQQRCVTGEDIAAAVERAKCGRGMRRARRALALTDGRSESVGETFARLAMRDAGLPALELQVNVYSKSGEFLGRCDFAHIASGVLIEFDGTTKYGRLRRPGESVQDVVLREKAREDRLREAGFVVVRLVWADLFDARLLADRIDDAIRRGQRSVAAGLVTGRCETTVGPSIMA